MSIPKDDILKLRDVLAELDPKSSASAASPLPIEQVYLPLSHVSALDLNRSLVVGNRGSGKSVWSGVLANAETRRALAGTYSMLRLGRVDVALGFHEDAGKVDDFAPSQRLLHQLLSRGADPEVIWTAVLLRAVSAYSGHAPPSRSLTELVAWVTDHVEEAEAALRDADRNLTEGRRKFLLVFDALDRLAADWDEIRPLSVGVLRLALQMQGFRSMRAKVFMRTDQAKDDTLFQFPDASKLRASRIDLMWHPTDLYGLLYHNLRASRASEAFMKLTRSAVGHRADEEDFADPLCQTLIFNSIAGEFMGSDRRRGRTYTWIIDHLADAFHETTPRSFLITLQRAANSRLKPTDTVIDAHGIREGVQQASEVRVDQLQEDYPWIRVALEHLEGLHVPCVPDVFTSRWGQRGTVKEIRRLSSARPGPIELAKSQRDPEGALLQAVKNIGVIEERSENKINMPDIFRVAAKIRRRGGVRPPQTTKRRS